MRRLVQRMLTVSVILASGLPSYVSANTSDASNLSEARKHYEQQKEQITHASDYMKSRQKQSRQALLRVEQSHEDAMNIKVEKNEK